MPFSAGCTLILVSDGKIYNHKNELVCTAIGTFNAYPIDKSDFS